MAEKPEKQAEKPKKKGRKKPKKPDNQVSITQNEADQVHDRPENDTDDERIQMSSDPLQEKLQALQAIIATEQAESYQWRVIRFEPKTWRGVRATGCVGYLPFQGGLPDEAAIAEQWGGGLYTCTLVDRGRQFVTIEKPNGDTTGLKLSLDIAGHPKIEPEPNNQEPRAPAGKDSTDLVLGFMQAQSTQFQNQLQAQQAQHLDLIKTFVPLMVQSQQSKGLDFMGILQNLPDAIDALADAGILRGNSQDDGGGIASLLKVAGETLQQFVDSRQQNRQGEGGEIPLQPSGELPETAEEIE